MLLTNGRTYTLDARGTIADTLVVRDGRVAFAGRRADVNAAPGEDIVDPGGRAALPGLVDAHGHLMHLARVRLTLDLRGARAARGRARGATPAGRVDQRAQRGPESVAGRTPSFQGHARSGRAGSSGRACAHRRACDLSRYRPRRSNPSISGASARAN